MASEMSSSGRFRCKKRVCVAAGWWCLCCCDEAVAVCVWLFDVTGGSAAMLAAKRGISGRVEKTECVRATKVVSTSGEYICLIAGESRRFAGLTARLSKEE